MSIGAGSGSAGVSPAVAKMRASPPRLRPLRGAVVLVSWALSVLTARAELRVVGSDLLGLDFSKAFYEYAGRHGVKLALAFDGSRPGLEQLIAGRADLGLIVVPPDEVSALRGFETQPLGFHRVVVLAPAACPVETITVAQLGTVFGAVGAAPRWGDLGASGEWTSAPIMLAAPEVGTGLALEYFQHVVLRGSAFRSNVSRFANAAELLAQFSRDARVLAIAAAPPSRASGIKVLPVASDAGQPGVHATPETLQAGSYPLGLAVQLVFRAERRTALQPLFEYLYGDAAARQLEAADVVALPAATRADQLRAMRLKQKPPN